MNDKDELIEVLSAKLEGAANMMRGMCLDPSIPDHAKSAMRSKIRDIDDYIESIQE